MKEDTMEAVENDRVKKWEDIMTETVGMVVDISSILDKCIDDVKFMSESVKNDELARLVVRLTERLLSDAVGKIDRLKKKHKMTG